MGTFFVSVRCRAYVRRWRGRHADEGARSREEKFVRRKPTLKVTLKREDSLFLGFFFSLKEKKKGLWSCFPSNNLVSICLQASEGTSKEVIKSGSKEAKEAAAKGSKKKVVKKKGGVSKPWWTQNEGPLPWEMAAAGIALALLLMFFFVVRPSASGLCFGRAAGDLLGLGSCSVRKYACTQHFPLLAPLLLLMFMAILAWKKEAWGSAEVGHSKLDIL